eukprot:Selendium_serpulae@DN6163_c1_g1_i4.p1
MSDSGSSVGERPEGVMSRDEMNQFVGDTRNRGIIQEKTGMPAQKLQEAWGNLSMDEIVKLSGQLREAQRLREKRKKEGVSVGLLAELFACCKDTKSMIQDSVEN